MSVVWALLGGLSIGGAVGGGVMLLSSLFAVFFGAADSAGASQKKTAETVFEVGTRGYRTGS
jgi:hypothetical protein